MKSPIFLSTSLLQKSFFEIDRKTRGSLYVYLWYMSIVSFIILLLEEFFLLDSSKDIILPWWINLFLILIFIIHLSALINLNLRRRTGKFLKWYIRTFFFGLYIQILPFVYMLFLIFICWGSVVDEKPIHLISSFSSSILDAMVALWALRHIFKLRRHALKKIS